MRYTSLIHALLSFSVVSAGSQLLSCSQAPQEASAKPSTRSTPAPRVATTSPEIDKDRFWDWGRAVHTAAAGSAATVKSWWTAGNPATSGVLPYEFVTTLPLTYGGLEAAPGVISIDPQDGAIAFRLEGLRTEPFPDAPPMPASLPVAGQDLAVRPPPISMADLSQPCLTLAGIAHGFLAFRDPAAEVVPGCIHQQLEWQVPAATQTALEAIGPISIRRSPEGYVALIFHFEERELAHVAINRKMKEGGWMKGVSTIAQGEALPFFLSDPWSWPELVPSLQDL